MNKLFLLVPVLFTACMNFDHSGKGNDVPTAGELQIGVDQADSFLISEELDLFRIKYPKSNVKPVYLCEVNLLKSLQMDSLRFVIMNRNLTAAEKLNLENRDIKVRSLRLAYTAIALIAHPGIPQDSLGYGQLKELLSGKQIRWSDGKSATLVFDGSCGANFRFMADSVLKGRIAAPGLGSFNHPRQVIDFVAKTPGALGFVGLNWISDKTDAESMKLQQSVKVLKVENPETGRAAYPFQSQIKTGQYPFVREVWMHDLQGYTGLGKGLMAFFLSQPGQILVKKSGLIPATDHGRTIVLEEE